MRQKLDRLRADLAEVEERRLDVIHGGMGIALDTQSHGRSGSSVYSDPTSRKAMELGEDLLDARREYVRLSRILGAIDAVLPEGSDRRTLISRWYWAHRGSRAKAVRELNISERTADRWRDTVLRDLEEQLPAHFLPGAADGV